MLDMVLPRDGDFVPTPSRPAPSQDTPHPPRRLLLNLLLLRFALVNLVAMAWLEGWLDLIRASDRGPADTGHRDGQRQERPNDPARELLTIKVMLRRENEELTVFRFKLDHDASLVPGGVSSLYRPLRSSSRKERS